MHHDGFAAGFGVGFHFAARADVDLAASGTIRLFNAATAVDDGGGREIGPRNVLHQSFDADIFVVDIGKAAVDHFRQVVRRNIGRHPDRDAGGTVHQQVRDFGRQNFRDLLGAVIVRHEVDGLFFQVCHQLMSNLRQTDFRITHCRGGVAVDGTEVALSVHQHVTQGERLSHADDGVVNGGIPVRVIFTDDVTDHTGGFLIGFVPVVTQFAHRVEHAAVDRLQAVTNIG